MRSREKTLLLKRASAVMVVLIMLLTLSSCAQNPEPRQQKESPAPAASNAAAAAALAAAEREAAGSNLAATDVPAADAPSATDAPSSVAMPVASAGLETPAQEEPKTVQAAAANLAADAPAAGSASLKDSHKASMSIQMDDGSFILANTLIDFETGDSVLSVLIKIGKENAIPVVFSGSKKNAYIQGINNIFEFDKGAESGWIYKVNGKTPMKSCGAYEVQVNDEIAWIYVTKLAEAMK